MGQPDGFKGGTLKDAEPRCRYSVFETRGIKWGEPALEDGSEKIEWGKNGAALEDGVIYSHFTCLLINRPLPLIPGYQPPTIQNACSIILSTVDDLNALNTEYKMPSPSTSERCTSILDERIPKLQLDGKYGKGAEEKNQHGYS
jgi:hypothetical protein